MAALKGLLLAGFHSPAKLLSKRSLKQLWLRKVLSTALACEDQGVAELRKHGVQSLRHADPVMLAGMTSCRRFSSAKP